MSAVAGLTTHSLSEAKATLSEVMSGVVHRHQPTLVERHGGKEAMLLMSLPDLAPLLARFSFHTKASTGGGEIVLRQSELGLIAGGETFDDASRELEELALAYAERYFERLGFYLQTDRAEQMPWLMRLIVTPPSERRALLLGEPEPPAR